MYRNKRTATGILAAALFAATVGAASAADKVAFRLDWTYYGPHAPFYLGVEKGLYKAEGLDVSIAEGNGSGNIAKILAQGTEVIAMMDYGVMMRSVAAGLPLKAVYSMIQQSSMTIVSHADAPIKSPKELEGKVIALAPAESTTQMFPVMMKAAKADQSKINVLAPAVGAKIALFLQKRVDAIAVSSPLIPLIESQGAKVYSFNYADFGLVAYDAGIVVNEPWAEKNGDILKRFLKATTAAWKMAVANPEEAIDAAIKMRPELAKSREVNLKQLKIDIGLMSTPHSKGKPIGWMAAEDWKAMVQQMVETKQVDKPVPLDKLYTNAYIPQ
jgi:NitT/TauT family transport system substrate-binding protein